MIRDSDRRVNDRALKKRERQRSKMNSLVSQIRPDQVFDQMLSTSFPIEEKLARFLNSKDKVEFIRRYTDLLDRLSYWKL